MPRAKSKRTGGGRARGGRRPISQRARARGVDAKPAHGRAIRKERKREHEGHELEHGRRKARRSRAQAQPSHSDYAQEGSRTTARQRRIKASELEKKRGPRAPHKANPPTRARSKRRGAHQIGSGGPAA